MTRPFLVRAILPALLVLLSTSRPPAGAAEPPDTPRTDGETPDSSESPGPRAVFGAGTTAVTLDVVVRDSRGRPITDLALDDFELLEGGARQRIADVQLVAPGARTSRTAEAVASTRERAGAPEPGPAPTFVALVFDRLSPEARARSHRGALAYLETSRKNDYAGVFLSDLSLVTVHPFTNDRDALRRAIDDVSSRPTSKSERFRLGSRAYGDTDSGVPPTAGPESEGPSTVAVDPLRTRTREPGSAGEAGLIAMMSRMERSFEALARDQQGHSTINSLLALVDGLGQLPGRKTIVFFADALAIPPHAQARFESVVAAANRGNVSVYSIDAAGLRVHSGLAETAGRVNSLGAEAIGRDAESDGKLMESLELNEDVIRRDPSVSLRLLADRTGGFLVDNTNDLAAAFREIDADRRFHYLLSYTPSNQDFDGAWRPVTVTVRRRGVTVRARAGYLAVRTPGTVPVLLHEAPALAALEQTPLPTAIPVRAAAYQFPDSPDARLAVLVEVLGAGVTQEVDPVSRRYRSDFTILARFVDAEGNVVRKASEPYRIEGPMEEFDRARSGRVLFYRQPTLPPGRYTFEYVVHDVMARKAGAGRLPLQVDAAGTPAVSSLVVVRRAEAVPAAERDAENPLYYDDLLLYPSLGEPVSRSRDRVMSLYCVVRASAPVSGRLVLLQNGAVLAETPVRLSMPDTEGRIQHVAQVPLADIAPGRYELTLTITSGSKRVTRAVTVEVVP